jgi:hypothetical protein
MKKIVLFLMMIILITPIAGQEMEWAAGFDGFLDNREYQNSVQYAQTIFGARTWLELGGNIDQIHRLRAGFNYMCEFGSTYNAIKPSPVLYYQLHYNQVNFYIGAFPRRDLLDFPLALLTDTINYYRPEMEGIYLSYNAGRWGYENVFIDWTSKKTSTDLEQYVFGFSGRLNYSILYLTHHALNGHYARPDTVSPDFHRRDNGGYNVNLGVDLSNLTFFDTMNISGGVLVSLDRIRVVYNGWETSAGFLAQAHLGYRSVGLKGTYYRGQGNEFLYGDSFYKAEEYGRLDIFWQPFRRKNVQGKIVFSLHFIEQSVKYSQQVLISVNLGGSKPLLHANNNPN